MELELWHLYDTLLQISPNFYLLHLYLLHVAYSFFGSAAEDALNEYIRKISVIFEVWVFSGKGD